MMDGGGIVQPLCQAQRDEVLRTGRTKLFLESRAIAPGYSIKNSCHKRKCLEQRLLRGRGHFLLLCPDLVLQAVVEVWEQKFDWHPENDAEAEGVDQGGQTLAALELPERRGVVVTEQACDVRGRERHPPSVAVQAILVSLFVLH